MDKVDQFESAFRAAARVVFHYRLMSIRSAMVVTDLDATAAEKFAADAQAFTAALAGRNEVSWLTITKDRFETAKDLLSLVEEQHPDLIVTYRCLHSTAWQLGFTLGTYIDVLTQATTTPVLLLPHPARDSAAAGHTDKVMAITDHLVGDQRLVNTALAFVAPHGTLYLTHVEDDADFERYIDAVGKIPDINTDSARKLISEQLLKEPRDYIHSVATALDTAGVTCTTEAVVTIGHRVNEYRSLIEKHGVDLLVMNTKDEDHSAMHGLAYALAVELRHTPLLML
jgi:hypothetical protein